MSTPSASKLIVSVFCFALATTISVALLDLSTGTAIAEPAIVVKQDAPCGMPGSDASGNLILGGVGAAHIIVENDNKVSLTCKGDGLINHSGRARHFSGFTCGLLIPSTGEVVATNDSHATVSRSGKGSLTCTFSKP